MVSVLIATFFGHLTHDHKIRPLSVENRTRHPYLAEKWRRLAAVAATVCPPRHIGDRQTATASLSAARLYSTQRRKCRIRYDNILMNSHFKIDSVLNCVMSMSMLLLGATVSVTLFLLSVCCIDVCLSVCLFCLSVRLFCLSVCVSTCMLVVFVCLSVCLPVYLFLLYVCLSACTFVPSVCFACSACKFVVSVCLSVCLSACMFVLFVCLFSLCSHVALFK